MPGEGHSFKQEAAKHKYIYSFGGEPLDSGKWGSDWP